MRKLILYSLVLILSASFFACEDGESHQKQKGRYLEKIYAQDDLTPAEIDTLIEIYNGELNAIRNSITSDYQSEFLTNINENNNEFSATVKEKFNKQNGDFNKIGSFLAVANLSRGQLDKVIAIEERANDIGEYVTKDFIDYVAMFLGGGRDFNPQQIDIIAINCITRLYDLDAIEVDPRNRNKYRLSVTPSKFKNENPNLVKLIEYLDKEDLSYIPKKDEYIIHDIADDLSN